MSIGRDHRSLRVKIQNSPKRAGFSIAYGNTKAYLIPTSNARMPIVFAGDSQVTRLLGSLRTWMQGPSNDGSTPATNKSMRMFFSVTGAVTIPLMEHIA